MRGTQDGRRMALDSSWKKCLNCPLALLPSCKPIAVMIKGNECGGDCPKTHLLRSVLNLQPLDYGLSGHDCSITLGLVPEELKEAVAVACRNSRGVPECRKP